MDYGKNMNITAVVLTIHKSLNTILPVHTIHKIVRGKCFQGVETQIDGTAGPTNNGTWRYSLLELPWFSRTRPRRPPPSARGSHPGSCSGSLEGLSNTPRTEGCCRRRYT